MRAFGYCVGYCVRTGLQGHGLSQRLLPHQQRAWPQDPGSFWFVLIVFFGGVVNILDIR